MTTKAKKDYSQGKIYKIEPIVEHDEGDIYIGSTTKQYLSQRMASHKQSYKLWVRNKTYTSTTSFNLFEKYGFDNCMIVLLENVDASAYDDLVAREAYYIRTLDCVNRNIPLRTYAEWTNDNKEVLTEKKSIYMKQYATNKKEHIKIYKKQYAEKNKEKIAQYKKQYAKEHSAEYRNNNKEKIYLRNKKYCENNAQKLKDNRKQYYENNNETIKEKQRIYREINRDKINERQRLAYQKKKQEKQNETNTLEIII